MEDNILAIGKMGNNTDKLLLRLKTELKEKVYGMMENE
jgi:hypothetical protein